MPLCGLRVKYSLHRSVVFGTIPRYSPHMTDRPKLGLRTMRRAQGKTLRGVARRAGVDASHLSRIERGLATPSLDTLVAVCRELGLRNVVDALKGLEER
jgi:DNA-binding XRE family transcriptional regulator